MAKKAKKGTCRRVRIAGRSQCLCRTKKGMRFAKSGRCGKGRKRAKK